MRSVTFYVFVLLLLAWTPAAVAQHHEEEGQDETEESDSRFSDEPIPLADLPDRPRPLLELGAPFLGTGVLSQGLRLPTGAVWQPALLVFGNLRTAGQSTSMGGAQVAEAAGRLDLFANLYLTQTERVLVGFRPLDQGGAFTSYTLHSSAPLVGDDGEPLDDFQQELNFGIRTLFFEGDFAELFPRLDWDDSTPLDYGIAVGRQPLSFQAGMLIAEDAIDAVGLTRANLRMGGLVNIRVSGLFAWGDIDRPAGSLGNFGDSEALLFGLFTETDTRKRTVELDAVYVTSPAEAVPTLGTTLGGDGVYLGLGSTRRIRQYSSTFRVVASLPVGGETAFNSTGVLIHEQVGWTPHHTHNWAYVNLYAGIRAYRSAVRGPANGGPLGGSGILYGRPGIGRYANALGNQSDSAVGGSLGYQMFFGHTARRQLIVEAGGRYTYDKDGVFGAARDAVAAGLRYQLAVGQRGVVTLGGFGTYDLDAARPNGVDALSYGSRLELSINL